MTAIRLLSRSDVVKALPIADAIEGMKRAYGALSAETVDMPLRVRISGQNDGVSLVMPAHLQESGDMGVKIVSVFPNNLAKQLPIIHAMVLVLDSATGQALAMMEGGSLTAIRTGAGAGAATDILARQDASSVAIIGSGVQARTQLEAVCAIRDIDTVRVYSPNTSNAEQFADDMAGLGRVPDNITVADSSASAITEMDIICVATTSSSPVFDGNLLQSGVHINGVGSYTPTMQEVDEITLQKSRIYYDSHEAILAEAGEIIIALENGSIKSDDLVAEIGAVVNGTAIGRQSDDDITFFKSVGVAVQDAVAANIVLDNAEALDLGTLFDLNA
ncbi:MAG: ornithine cyclodeaminase family protein [Chloroflexota bacterium]